MNFCWWDASGEGGTMIEWVDDADSSTYQPSSRVFARVWPDGYLDPWFCEVSVDGQAIALRPVCSETGAKEYTKNVADFLCDLISHGAQPTDDDAKGRTCDSESAAAYCDDKALPDDDYVKEYDLFVEDCHTLQRLCSEAAKSIYTQDRSLAAKALRHLGLMAWRFAKANG